MMSKIIRAKDWIQPVGYTVPSIHLKTIGVHKLGNFQDCKRYFYWRWIFNIEPKRMSLPFWFGSMVHAGYLTYCVTGSRAKAIKAMKAEDKIYKKRYTKPVNTAEMEILSVIAYAMVRTFIKLYGRQHKGFKLLRDEIKFCVPLDECPVDFIGAVDGYGSRNKVRSMLECKTAARLNDDYFRKLRFDLQVNGYKHGITHTLGVGPRECRYMVFRKPQIRQRKTETVDQFITRLKQDLLERCDWYFVPYTYKFGKTSVRNVMTDINWETSNLFDIFEYKTKEQILDPDTWPRCASQCLNWGTCVYFNLCHQPKKWKLYLPFYQMREVRYDPELPELDTKIKLALKPQRKWVASTLKKGKSRGKRRRR
jgi:hypothetical protein